MAKKVQKYEGSGITVHFDPNRCMHAGRCVHELPEVFDVNRRPWIMPDAADAETVVVMVNACPSGALSYEKGGEPQTGCKPDRNHATVMPDGPLYLHAGMTINGEPQPTCRAALCRCGATKNPPFCDGEHKAVGFRDRADPTSGAIDENSAVDGCLEIVAIEDGPLMLRGGCEVRNIKDELMAKGDELFLCRCGASDNKPYCDGSHNKIGFRSK